MSASLATLVIENFRLRLGTDLPKQIRTSLGELTDEQIWWRPNESSNSVGNLVLHLCGSLRHFLGRGVGGSDYQRDRPKEFSEREPIPKAALLRTVDETFAEAQAILGRLTPERLTEMTDRAGAPTPVYELVLRMAIHVAMHTGQILYITKMLKEGVFPEMIWSWSNTR